MNGILVSDSFLQNLFFICYCKPMPFVVTGMLIVTTSTWSEWSGVDSGKIFLQRTGAGPVDSRIISRGVSIFFTLKLGPAIGSAKLFLP